MKKAPPTVIETLGNGLTDVAVCSGGRWLSNLYLIPNYESKTVQMVRLIVLKRVMVSRRNTVTS